MIIPALRRGGYQFAKHVVVGDRPGGGKHVVDVVASDGTGRTLLISLKWQQVSGTAEQKVPYEVICLAHALRTHGGRYQKAYLVLGGEGWKLRDFYTSGGLRQFMVDTDAVDIVTLEDFVGRANRRQL